MDSLPDPSSKPFHRSSMPPLSSSFSPHNLNLSSTHQLAQSAYDDLSCLLSYPLSPPSQTSNYRLDHDEPSSSVKEGWERILDEISRGVNPTQIIDDYDDSASVMIGENHTSTNIGDILNFLEMQDTACEEEAVKYSDTPRRALCLSALDWDWYGLEQAQAKRSRRLTSSSGCEGESDSLEDYINDDGESELNICKGPSITAKPWAGPTLRDIEAALAHTACDPPPSSPMDVNSSSPSVTLSCESSSANPPCSPALPHVLGVRKAHHLQQQEAIHTHPLDIVRSLQLPFKLPACSEQITIDDSWRYRLQKRNNGGPKETRKVGSEEEALGDGYRWRKYGQKVIKNSPFKRSYYRCTSGKCNAKKQVERCDEGDKALFLVTYEGLHLHHKPNYLRKLRMKLEGEDKNNQKSFDMCSPTSSTHGSSYVDSTNIESLTSCSLPPSPLSQSSTLDILLTIDDFFSPAPTSQWPLHNDVPSPLYL